MSCTDAHTHVALPAGAGAPLTGSGQPADPPAPDPCLQILLGLNHMHSRKILHRDIKTLNVFLDDHLNVKLGDMGVAKVGCTLAGGREGCPAER